MDLSVIIGELQDQRNIRDQCRSNSVTFINVRIAVEYLYKYQSGLEMVPHLTDLFSQFHSLAFIPTVFACVNTPLSYILSLLGPSSHQPSLTSLYYPQLSHLLILCSLLLPTHFTRASRLSLCFISQSFIIDTTVPQLQTCDIDQIHIIKKLMI